MEIARRFRVSGIPTPVLDAEIIAAYVLGIDRYALIASRGAELSRDARDEIEALAARRLAGEPVAYLTGRKEFYSLDLFVDSRVLIPRPETELLVDLAIYYAPMNGSVLDLGTGSGAIAVAVKHTRGDCNVCATDISREALEVAAVNAAAVPGAASIDFRHGDLFAPVEGERFHVIVSNPPYVDRNLMPGLQRELRFEPEAALCAGDGGRDVIGRIISGAGEHLLQGGVAIVEIAETMREYVRDEGERSGFTVSVMNDYAGLPRVAVLKP
ncbi:MAG: peptide chain release factor N(5)-glutamine methyltransferase [Spirochaetes bacterium]|nr:peptide chain release factor N(5)-glutamine methyltransferase [Spirochaetota bacterium]